MAYVNDLISQITQAGGLSRPNRYSVQIVPPVISRVIYDQSTLQQRTAAEQQAQQSGMSVQSLGYVPNYFKQLGLSGIDMPNRLDYMCCKAELPGKSFGASDVRTYGAFFQMPYVDFYANTTMSFIMGRDAAERKFFDAWSYLVQDPETSDFNYVADYATTIDVFQLDEFQDTAQYGVRFFQAWPINIGAMSVSYDQFNTYHILPITFSYRKWVNFSINTGSPTTIEPSSDTPAGFESTIHLK
jgi:hypothetical protein